MCSLYSTQYVSRYLGLLTDCKQNRFVALLEMGGKNYDFNLMWGNNCKWNWLFCNYFLLLYTILFNVMWGIKHAWACCYKKIFNDGKAWCTQMQRGVSITNLKFKPNLKMIIFLFLPYLFWLYLPYLCHIYFSYIYRCISKNLNSNILRYWLKVPLF